MAQAIAMLHKADPRSELQDKVDKLVGLIQPLGTGVMVAVYKRPARTAGGIILTDKTKDEDDYQGKVGLVLKLGPIAFEDDATHRFGDAVPKPGDWIVYNVGETFSFELGSQRCRIIEDVSVRAIIDQPDIVW
jgi:co-chaperonin GroES (HSP10)